MTFKKRPTPAPCICGGSFNENEEIVFCPDCGEPYHDKCWEDIEKKCKVSGCPGHESKLWKKLEHFFIQLFDIKNTDLLSHCPNCNHTISYLDRYCMVCGTDVNSPKTQKTFIFYPFAKWTQRYHKIILMVFSILLMTLISTSVIVASATIKSIKNNFPANSTTTHLATATSPTQQRAPTSVPPTSKPSTISTSVSPTSRPSATVTIIPPIPENYMCPDLDNVTLYIGAKASVAFDNVSLRSYAKVPNVWDANIIAILDKGDKVTIIGGPTCSHDGTWWETETKQGKTGWMREFLPDKRLLKLRN